MINFTLVFIIFFFRFKPKRLVFRDYLIWFYFIIIEMDCKNFS